MLTVRGSSAVLLLAMFVCTSTGCPETSGMTPAEPTPPAPPTALEALPESGRAVLSWSSAGGATGFKVYYAVSPQVTTSDPSVAVTASPAIVPSLANGTPYYFAVSAVNAAGEGPLSSVACAVPTPADTTGLTLFDPLCGEALDGSRWGSQGAYGIGVSDGAAELSVNATNQASRLDRGVHYTVTASARTGSGQRVTTIAADVRVPSATASRTGGAEIRGSVRLVYQPPSLRFDWPDSVEHFLALEVGLIDSGAGLMAFRSVTYCDVIRCPAPIATGISFEDPEGLSPLGAGRTAAPAAYDATYRVTASLDEATGLFHWTIAGGSFGAGLSGTADPSAYLAVTPAWSGVPLAGSGFARAQLITRTFDPSPQGGGSGRIAVRFDDVQVGLNGGAAAAFDDFGGASGNSGPEELSVAKWVAAGSDSVQPSGGRLTLRSRVTSTGFATGTPDRLNVAYPESIHALQADVAIDSTVDDGASAHVGVQGTFYNDGTDGSAPASPLGDVLASVFLYPGTNRAVYTAARCANATCSAVTPIASGTFAGVTVGTARHTVLVKWDRERERFTFGVDGQTVEVDPADPGLTSPAPFAGSANAPVKRLFGFASVPSVAGTRARAQVTVNNVFVAR
jgi:hypothetical protein